MKVAPVECGAITLHMKLRANPVVLIFHWNLCRGDVLNLWPIAEALCNL